MRVIVYGLGAVGGVVAASLARAGGEVVGIARGAMLEAVRSDGLRLSSVEGEDRLRLDCVGHPSEIDFRPDDAILLCMKGQDTDPALAALREAGVAMQPVFCCQNGVENERRALRIFPNVHGVTVMMPATYVAPGHVASFVAPQFGMFDIGRFPSGSDADDARLAKVLWDANIAAFVQADVMPSKYGKLLMNLTNIVEAAVGSGQRDSPLGRALRSEALAAYSAAGVAYREVDGTDPRRARHIHSTALDGVTSAGGSTLQSLLRGTGSLETDMLNGEISYLGRMHGVATPLNDAMMRLSVDLLSSGAEPGGMTIEDLAAQVGF